MSFLDDHQFLAHRARQEQAAAARAIDDGVRTIHLDLAERYQRRLADLGRVHDVDGAAA